MNISNPKNLLTTLNAIISCLMLFAFNSLSAQTNDLDKFPVEVSPDNLTIREVGYMAVFPGCEKIDVNDKKGLQSCLAKEISNLLAIKLENFANELDKKGLTSAIAKLQFVIDKNGKIIQIKAMEGGNLDLAIASEKALTEISNEIAKIQPATLEDGTPVNLVFQLPVRYEVTEDAEEPQYEWNELVFSTLKDENKVYEIRLSKKEGFYVYEVLKNTQIFLGKYDLIQEIYQLDPYRSMLEKSGGKIMITEGMLNNKFLRFYIPKEDQSNVYVYELKEEDENLIEKVNFKDFFFLPKYSELLVR